MCATVFLKSNFEMNIELRGVLSSISQPTERTPLLSNSLHTTLLCLHVWYLYCTKFISNIVILV